jgi:DNA-binding HxlR family transcriptional regulator
MLRTKSQCKKICGACPIAKTADLVGDSVILLIVRDLIGSPKRFKDITTSLAGVSTRTLTNKLKFLEEKGLVVKEEQPTKPPHTAYVITEKGRGLEKVIKSMEQYGNDFL